MESESFLEEIQKEPSSAKHSTDNPTTSEEAAEDEDDEDEDDDLESIFSHDSDDDPTWAPSRDDKVGRI